MELVIIQIMEIKKYMRISTSLWHQVYNAITVSVYGSTASHAQGLIRQDINETSNIRNL
jgi:hypothetical protein